MFGSRLKKILLNSHKFKVQTISKCRDSNINTNICYALVFIQCVKNCIKTFHKRTTDDRMRYCRRI